MGRGDRKTRKGKRAIRSYGNVRPHNAMTTPTGPVVKKAAPAKAAVKKAAPAARKAAPKKRCGQSDSERDRTHVHRTSAAASSSVWPSLALWCTTRS